MANNALSNVAGIPSGGNQGDVLTKDSGSDYDTIWSPNSNKVCLQYTIPDPENRTYKLFQYVPVAFTLEDIYYDLDVGTCSLNVRLEAVSVGGWSSLSATTTEGTASATSNDSVAVGDTLDLVVSSVSSADMLSITIVGTES
tara:strand:+ start:480 stop:905 length:426 start_codon:yes stop_codon:yes gene_type:complete